MSLTAGFVAEEIARDHLIQLGMRFVERNYRCKLGEIDLIMRDNDYWVFVEVRSRASSAFGGAIESVTYSKQQKLLKTASLYLLTQKLHDTARVRFDVVTLEGKPPQLTWISNAFTA